MQDIATDIETYKRISNNETIEMKKTYNKYNCNPFKLLSITWHFLFLMQLLCCFLYSDQGGYGNKNDNEDNNNNKGDYDDDKNTNEDNVGASMAITHNPCTLHVPMLATMQ